MSQNPYEQDPLPPKPQDNEPPSLPEQESTAEQINSESFQGSYQSAAGQAPYPQAAGQAPYPQVGGQAPYPQAAEQPQQAPYPQTGGQAPYPQAAAYPAGSLPEHNTYPASPVKTKKGSNILGIVGLVLGVLGTGFGLKTDIVLIGWILLFAAFVLGLVGLFMSTKEKVTPILAIILSVLGSLVSAVAFFIYLIFNPALSGSADSSSSVPDSLFGDYAAASPAASETPPPALTSSGPLPFGQTAEYEDGLKVTVSQVDRNYTPSDTSAGGEDPALGEYLVFNVTLENSSDQPFEAWMLVDVSSGGVYGDQIFDFEQGIEGVPDGTILPGEKISFDVAFAVADSQSVTLEFSPDIDRDEARFSNSLEASESPASA